MRQSDRKGPGDRIFYLTFMTDPAHVDPPRLLPAGETNLMGAVSGNTGFNSLIQPFQRR